MPERNGEKVTLAHGGCMAAATDAEHLCSVDCVPEPRSANGRPLRTHERSCTVDNHYEHTAEREWTGLGDGQDVPGSHHSQADFESARAARLDGDHPCPCWANTHALGHEGHCCFTHSDRKVGGRFKDDEAICHVREGVKIALTSPGERPGDGA